MDEARDIPTNVEALTQLCIEQRVTLQANRFEIEHLRLQVARLRGLKFGQSSERLSRMSISSRSGCWPMKSQR